MEVFLRSLSCPCPSTPIHDVTYACQKILDWAYKACSSSLPLSFKDVENIGKGVVYVNVCYKLFGKELVSQLINQYPFFSEQVKMVFGNNQDVQNSLAEHILKKLAQTTNGSDHIYHLELILNTNNELNNFPISIDYCSREIVSNTSSSSKCKLYTLVQKIFQLPRDQVGIAIDRSLNTIPFSTIGLVFCKLEKNTYSDAWDIFAHKISEKLYDGSISPLFVNSLYITASTSQRGLEHYWLCLNNTVFKRGICALFIQFLVYLSEKGIKANDDVTQITYKKHKAIHIIYLIWAALLIASPCRSELYKLIIDADLNSLLHILNKFERIYN